jgi:predicted nucleic acid-binding protein
LWKNGSFGLESWVDAHLIASALLSRCILRTQDERLKHAARKVGVTQPH